MNAPAHYFHWGFVLITVANLLVILLMIAIFALAVLLPFPFGERSPEPPPAARADSSPEHAS